MLCYILYHVPFFKAKKRHMVDLDLLKIGIFFLIESLNL